MAEWADFGLERTNLGPERGRGGGANFVPQRTVFGLSRLILGLRGLFWGLKGASGGELILGLRGLIFCLSGLILGLRGLIWGLRGALGRTDRQTDRRNGSPLCPTGHRPFGAAAQKKGKK